MTDKALCAVDGCDHEGKPQICPFDHRAHRHGCIHYGCGYPASALTYRAEGWHWICDEHYKVVQSERAAFEANSGHHHTTWE